MLPKTAIRIIWYEKAKFLGAISGVTFAVFVVIMQWGLYLGYKKDITVVIDAFDADIWIAPRGQPSVDGVSSMDDLAYWRARELPEISKAARVAWGFGSFRHPREGASENAQVLGVEFQSGIGLNLETDCADLMSALRPDGHILVGRKNQEQLGVYEAGVEGAEIYGRRAVVVGFVENVHLFTTFGFVLTDFDNARTFLKMPSSHTTYVVCKCRDGEAVDHVVRRLRSRISDVDVFTTTEFRDLTSKYWQTKTKIGPLLLIPSILAAVVAFLLVALTFYISTIQKLPLYASLKAIGASTGELILILGIQVLVIFVIGSVMGGLCVWPVVTAARSTTISVVILPAVILRVLGLLLLSSAIGALLSINRVVRVEPGIAFRT